MTQPVAIAGAAHWWLRAAPVLFLLIWSCSFVFLKLGLRYTDPLTFLALRWACVVCVLLLAFGLVRPRLPATARAWGNLAMVGLFLQVGYLVGTYLSLKAGVSAGAVALITSQQPILIGLLAPAVAGERVDARRWAGLVLGVLGACVVVLANAAISIASPAGLLFALLALFSLSASTLWEKRFGIATHPITANLVQSGVGLLVIAPLAYLLEPMRVQWSLPLLGSLAYLVFATSLVAITLLLAMIRQGEASRVSALFFLVPPVTAMIAYAMLGEAMAPLAWLGMALAALGIYLVMRPAES
jgi:drug/metabolite transporter (DMT)-like permease